MMTPASDIPSGSGAPSAGKCRACGRDLVHVPGERTYHPAAVLGPNDSCSALLPIPGTNVLSGNVPDEEFLP